MVETVAEICLVELNGAMGWVGEKDSVEDLLEGMPKLHDFCGSWWGGPRLTPNHE